MIRTIRTPLFLYALFRARGRALTSITFDGLGKEAYRAYQVCRIRHLVRIGLRIGLRIGVPVRIAVHA